MAKKVKVDDKEKTWTCDILYTTTDNIQKNADYVKERKKWLTIRVRRLKKMVALKKQLTELGICDLEELLAVTVKDQKELVIPKKKATK